LSLGRHLVQLVVGVQRVVMEGQQVAGAGAPCQLQDV
jgi:hypothetical protein